MRKNRLAHSGARKTVSRGGGGTPYFIYSVMEAAPSWGSSKLAHCSAG